MSFNKKQLTKDSPKKNSIDLKLKPFTKNPNYKYGFSNFEPKEGNIMLGAGFGNSKIGMGAMGMTPLDAENRKYFKGLVDANINYNVNPNLNFKLGINDVIGGGFNPNFNAGIKYKFGAGGGLLSQTMKCNSCGWSWKAVDGGNDIYNCHKCGGKALPQNFREGGSTYEGGGEPEYIYLELDDNAIQQYRNGGWVVEEMPEYKEGGANPNDPPKKSDDGAIHVTDPNDPDYLKYLEHNKLYRKLKNNLRAKQAKNAEGNLKRAKDWLDMVKNDWGETYDDLNDKDKKYYNEQQKVIAEKGIDKDFFSYSKWDVDKERNQGRDVLLSDEDESYLEQAKALGLDIRFKGGTDSKFNNPIVPRPKQKYIFDKATKHKDKIKNYKTGLEEYSKEVKAFEEYDKGYNQRKEDWKNNYNSYKEKLNKDWGEARKVQDWKVGLNNADGRGVDYLINQGFDIDDITWNDLHWVQQNIIKEGEGFNSSSSFIKPVLNKFTEKYTGVNPAKPTKPKVTLPEGYSYKQYPSRDGDMNDYLKGNKRISREEFIEATGYAPVQYRERHIKTPDFQKGGSTEPEIIEATLPQEAIDFYISQGYEVEYLDKYPLGGVISQHGWDYKKEGDEYLTKKADAADWITAKGDALKAIKSNVYNEPVSAPTPQTSTEQSTSSAPRTTEQVSITELQQGLADEKYYLGPKGVDGFMGKFTMGAQKAKEAGISAEDYNKRFEQQELATLPGVTVPSTVVENANTGTTTTRPTSVRPSAAAESSLQQAYVGERGWQSGEPEDIKFYNKDDEYLGDKFSTSPIIDINDEIYSHADDFIIDMEGGKRNKDLTKMKSEMHQINRDAGSCLKGALNCNQAMVANKVGANSIRGLIAQMDTQLASNTRYSIPSQGGSVGDRKRGVYKHTKGYDAWETGDALVGEGLAQDLYKIEPDHKDFNRSKYKLMTTDFKENYVDKGLIPLGALVFQGNTRHKDYTDPKYGNRSSHGTTVVGFNKEGLPLIYDNGNLTPITEPLLAINRVVIPKGYENYTYSNLKKGRRAHIESLGYDPDNPDEPLVKYKADPIHKDYVTNIYKGIHKVKDKVGIDYNIPENVMSKLSKRVVGIGGKESNFGNYGDEKVSFLRQLAIETESGLTSSLGKPIIKGIQNQYKLPMAQVKAASGKKTYPDWKIEIAAYNNVDGDMDKFKAEYTKLRNKYMKPTVLDDAGYNSSSVGVFAIKKLPEYAEKELGIWKSDLYGATVDDDQEFQKGAQASLVHLVESYTELKNRYKEKFELTDDDLIDLATVAYNSGGKAYDEDFIQFYIKDKKMPDNYLTKTKKLEQKYAPTSEERLAEAQEAAAIRAKELRPSYVNADNSLDAEKYREVSFVSPDINTYNAPVAESTAANVSTVPSWINEPVIPIPSSNNSGRNSYLANAVASGTSSFPGLTGSRYSSSLRKYGGEVKGPRQGA